MHCVLKFEQEAWLEPYITLNTTKRQQARNKFEEDLYNFLKHCADGRTCESKPKQMLVRIFEDYQATLREIIGFEFKSNKNFKENLTVFTSSSTKKCWNGPTMLEARVSDLEKFHIYKFHYDIMKIIFEFQLRYFYEI